MSKLPAHTAAGHLAEQIRIQTKAMTRKGIAPERIEAELGQLQAAIHAAIQHLRLRSAP